VSAPVKSADKLDPVWKALSDPTRRAILDLLRDRQRTTSEIVAAFPGMTRFGVMKHLDVLRKAGLVQTHESGRQRVNSLNAMPIRQIYEHWVGPFQELWTGHLLGLKAVIEAESPGGEHKAAHRAKRKKE
jgi:DNA-binding transcriptional ArsR family regulator